MRGVRQRRASPGASCSARGASVMAERRWCSAFPVEVCPSCGQVWLSMDVAKRLDIVFDRLLASGAESAQVHWEQPRAA